MVKASQACSVIEKKLGIAQLKSLPGMIYFVLLIGNIEKYQKNNQHNVVFNKYVLPAILTIVTKDIHFVRPTLSDGL